MMQTRREKDGDLKVLERKTNIRQGGAKNVGDALVEIQEEIAIVLDV
jgi:hypothetical protein